MDDFGDYIYLIALLVGGVVSIFQSVKKSKAKKESKPVKPLVPRESRNEMPMSEQKEQATETYAWEEDNSDTFWKEEDEHRAKEEPIVIVSTNKTPKVEPTYTYMNMAAPVMTSPQEGEHSVLVEPIVEDVENSEMEAESISLDNMEDVRRAIIYSEILNRKY